MGHAAIVMQIYPVEVTLIAAMSRNMCIGSNGQLPWHYHEDMMHFRRQTMGHPVAMGRKTWESLPSRPLACRLNLVLSRSDYDAGPGAVVCDGIVMAMELCVDAGRMFVAGGAEVYREAMPYASSMLITWVPDDPAGDAFFPVWVPGEWDVASCDQRGCLEFILYTRKKSMPPCRG